VSGSDTLGVTDNEPAFVDPGYSETGLGWELVLNALEPQYPGYGGDWRYHAGFGAGAAVATWEATNVTPGQFKVYVTWVPFNNRASNARYTIYDGAMIAGAFQLDQEYPPVADLMLGGRPFQSLGTYTIESTSLSVKLTDDANGYVIADHAVFERVGELPAMLTLAMGVDQASEPSGTATATLTRKYGGTSTDLEVTLQSSDTSEATVPATVTIPAGFTSVTFDVHGHRDRFPGGDGFVAGHGRRNLDGGRRGPRLQRNAGVDPSGDAGVSRVRGHGRSELWGLAVSPRGHGQQRGDMGGDDESTGPV
jgi:hypothetical protein